MINMERNNEYLICYHKEDNDGVFSAAMLFKYINYTLNIPEENIHLLGLDYNDISKYKRKDIKSFYEKYGKIFMTDISFPLSLMEYVWKLWGNDFTWVDHHAPRIAEVANSKKIENILDIPGIRETNRSAILCMYKYLYDPFDIQFNEEHEKIPKILRLLSAWDSYTFKQEGFELDYVKKVNEGINFIYNLNIFDVIDMLPKDLSTTRSLEYINHIEEDAYHFGSIIDNRLKQQFAQIMEMYADKDWKVIEDDGTVHTACAITLSGKSDSTMFETLKGKVDCGIVFKMEKDDKWAMHLYNIDSSNEFHCGKFLAERYKGGGHSGAAGAQIKRTKFAKLLRTKTI